MKPVLLVPLLALALTGLAAAQVKISRVHDRDAWTLETSRLRVTVMQSGGHIAEILLREPGAINPLWVQSQPTIDPEHYDAARHAKLYGGSPSARLLSGLLGHNVCFPFWGGPSEAEFRAGMTFHGETGVVRWKRLSAPAGALEVAADLAESRTRFTRRLSVQDQVVYFDSTAENLSAWDRPVGWCEHVTLGPPFLEKAVTLIDASLTRGRADGDASGREFAWPRGEADLRTVPNVAASGFVHNFLVDPTRRFGFFTAVHPRLRLLIGYIFPRSEFPWLNVWEANNAGMLTRGMEFSNTPTHGTMRVLVAAPRLWDTPAYEWLDARGRLRKRFAAFTARVPQDYRGVADVRLESGKLQIVERDTGRVTRLPFDASRLGSSHSDF